jgi:hypothetical protein
MSLANSGRESETRSCVLGVPQEIQGSRSARWEKAPGGRVFTEVSSRTEPLLLRVRVAFMLEPKRAGSVLAEGSINGHAYHRA